MDCSPLSSSVHGILQARILEGAAIPFSREIFLTQGWNPGLLHCRQILHQLSHQGTPLYQHKGLLKIFNDIDGPSMEIRQLHEVTASKELRTSLPHLEPKALSTSLGPFLKEKKIVF